MYWVWMFFYPETYCFKVIIMGNTCIHAYKIYTDIYMIFINEGFLEVAVQSWPEWDLNPRQTGFHSDALTNLAIRPWVHLTLRANLVQLLQLHLIVQCWRFISAIAFVSRHICFKRNLAQVITLVVEWIDTYDIHHWRIFRSIESWPEWDLNPRPLNSVQTLEPTELSDHEFNSHSESTLYSYFNFISLFSTDVSFRPLPLSVTTFALSEIDR